MNNNEIINQIKSELDIADIIGERVKLRKSGRGYMGLCPFHSEDTPSFHVYTDTQSYYCFGCHEAGDVFSYVMKTEGLSFPEALRVLADRAGVRLPESGRRGADVHGVLDLAAKFFSNNLTGPQGAAARAYMSRRSLTDSDISRYGLGYSLPSWDSLTNYLRRSGVNDRMIIDSGLAVANRNGLYDRFRGRLMFPIRDVTGKVIAFGGRLVDGEGAKYINSPEGPTYSKRNSLYLLDTARHSIREKKRSILAEGYMDALRLNKCGFPESVASLGTSLTAEQAGLLSRYADRCYICYDSDTAGQEAAIKGMYILASHGLDVYVVSLPKDKAKDPDEFLCANPPAAFEGALSEAKPLVLKHLEFLKPRLMNQSTRRSALSELFEALRTLDIDDVLRHLGSICDATLLPANVIEQYITTGRAPQPKPRPRKPALTVPKPQDLGYDILEAAMCALLFRNQECRLKFTLEDAEKLLHSDITFDTAAAILSSNPDELYTLWRTSGDDDKLAMIYNGEELVRQMLKMDVEKKFSRTYSGLMWKSINRRIKEIQSMPFEQRDYKELTELYRQREHYHL